MDTLGSTKGQTVAVCDVCHVPLGCFDLARSEHLWKCSGCEDYGFCEKRYFFLDKPIKRVTVDCGNCQLKRDIEGELGAPV